jgi:hypothetical protein
MNLNDIEEVLGTLALGIESNYKPNPFNPNLIFYGSHYPSFV